MFILRCFTDDDTKTTRSGEPLRRLNFDEVNTLKGSVAKALNNSSIGKIYIKDLIEMVAENTKGTIMSTDINELFNMVAASRGDNPINGGIWIYQKWSTASTPNNYWDWRGGKGFAEIRMAFSGDLTYEQSKLPEEQKTTPRYASLLRRLVDPYRGGMPTIHELMHVAVKGFVKGTTNAFGSDKDYTEAVAKLAGEKFPRFSPGTDLSSATSRYWDDRLCQACGYPSLYTHEFTKYPLYEKLPLLIDKNISDGSA